MENMIEISKGELYVLRDALLEQDGEDVQNALAIVEGLLYQPETPLDFNEGQSMKVGIIGDTHEPYCLEGYLEFCQQTFKDWGVDTVVHIGDLVDHHALSFHDSEPTLKGANGEMMDARERLKPWYKAFPDAKLCYGNHDILPFRQAKSLGIPRHMIRNLNDIYCTTRWEWANSWDIDGVHYHHG